MAQGSSGRKTGGARRGKSAAGETTLPPDSPESNEATRSSSGSSSNPLGLEPDSFTPPDEPTPADPDIDLDLYEPPAPEALEWTPERAGAVVRGVGFLLHTADPISREPEAVELWRATESDVDAIGPPLARILNRYEPARRLAGVSDETELAFGMIGYLRTNMATRGRAITAKRERETPPDDGAPTWAEPPAA